MKHNQRNPRLKLSHDSPIDPVKLAYVRDPLPDERAVLILASAYQSQERDVGCVTWSNQVKASEYYNAHGLADTLAECLSIDPNSLD